MTSRIRFVVETVENRGKTVWLVGVNREETVHGRITDRALSNGRFKPQIGVGYSDIRQGFPLWLNPDRLRLPRTVYGSQEL